jgi:hypothetical protein
LVQQGLEEVEVAAVDKTDAQLPAQCRRQPSEVLGAVEAAKAAANDQHFVYI